MLLEKRIPVTYILNKVKYDILYVLIVSLVVLFITEKYQALLPEMPLTIPAFIGTAISILLSFKLSQSYDRWWEARKIWGAIVNDSRSLVIQLQSFTSKGNEAVVKKIALRQIAWCYSLAQSLRGKDPMEGLEDFISAEDMQELKKHDNKPLAILQLHSKDIKGLKDAEKLDVFSQIQLDNTLVRLCDAQGKAERIKSTVFPVTYRLFLHGIIYLFIVALSVALNDVAGIFEIPLFTGNIYSFSLLEKSAKHMQDPFENRPTDTPMTSISRKIEINIKNLINDTKIPQVHPPESYYLT